MNSFFHFKRFGLLAAKHWADHKRRYLLCCIAYIGLLVTWFAFTMFVDDGSAMHRELQLLTFLFALFSTGTFYASQYFRELGFSSKGINFLLVPASAFEKILCSILYSVVLFFLVFVAGFYIADVLMVTVADRILPDDNREVLNIFTACRLSFEEGTTLPVLPIFFSIQAFFLLGSVYFKKYAFIKTIISAFIIFFSLFLLVFLLYDQVMPRGEYTSGFLNSYRVEVNGAADHLVQVPAWMGQLLYYGLLYAAAPFLWIVTYYRLKEKQV